MRLLCQARASCMGRENQDFVEVRQSGDALLLALADGQGGQAGGALAARVAVRTALGFLEEETETLEGEHLRLAVILADEAVEDDVQAGYGTLIVVCVAGNRIIGASVGDSQVWYLGDDEGRELSEEQHKKPPVGSGEAVATAFDCMVQAGEQVLVMSDGVFRFVEMDDIVRVCREEAGEDVLEGLCELQKRGPGGELPDDWSAVLIRF